MESTFDVSFGEGSSIQTSIGGFTVTADIPAKLGGDGKAPSPFDLFLASLGACAAVFARRFCDQHGVDGKSVGIQVACEWHEKEYRVTRMTFRLTLPEGFPEKLKAPLIRAVEGCPVKTQVLAAPEFAVELVG